jgi:predicted RNase H-like HicB family nuclease
MSSFLVEVKDSKFTVILREEAEGYSAQVVELPGCISQGRNRKEAIANIREVIEATSKHFQKN